ncbi:MAG: RNA-binding S4 domain-containing protein [Lentimonas sp.]
MNPEQSHSKLSVGRSTLDIQSVRLDKWLWAVRVYKTRSDAAEACRGSAVRIDNVIAKPSGKVHIGNTVIARTKAITKTLYVVGLTDKRVGPPAVSEYYEDRTPEADIEAAREKRANAKLVTHKGAGRPTKKDRRDIEKLLGPE